MKWKLNEQTTTNEYMRKEIEKEKLECKIETKNSFQNNITETINK